jgi:hypothetical protein
MLLLQYYKHLFGMDVLILTIKLKQINDTVHRWIGVQ